MTVSEKPPLSGFRPETGTFYVRAHNLKVERVWSNVSVTGVSASTETSVQIKALATCVSDDVCVIGTDNSTKEFRLTIRKAGDANQMRADWAERRRLRELVAREDQDTPERRIWNHINEELDKSPPTATLYFAPDDRGVDLAESWGLECLIPDHMLEQLVADLVAQRTNYVLVGIQWVCGLAQDDSHWSPGFEEIFKFPHSTRWGMFKLTEDAQPESLEGHVAITRWALGGGQAKGDSHFVTDEDDRTGYREYVSRVVEKFLEELTERGTDDTSSSFKRCRSALNTIATPLARRSSAFGSDAGAIRRTLNQAASLVERLDEALHQEKGPFVKESYSLWRHIKIADMYGSTKPSQREEIVDLAELQGVTTTYLENDQLQNPYLDWVLLDALAVAAIVTALEQLLAAKNGVAYVLFEGVPWKMMLWKLVTKPIAFALGWIAPAVGCFFLAQWSLPLSITIASIYYATSALMLGWWLWHRISLMLSGKRTLLRRAAEIIEEAEKAYSTLAGPVMHVGIVRSAFERAATSGVTWDHRVFYILDRLTEQKLHVWTNQAHYS